MSSDSTTVVTGSVSVLRSTAKPFTFNPNAKSFSFEPPKPVVVVKPRITYTPGEIFALQQPLYSGSTLILNDEIPELGEILLYDPCFDYISAGLITAVPIEQAAADGTLLPMFENMLPLEEDDTTFNTANLRGSSSSKVSPKQSKNNSPKKSKRTSAAQTAQPSPVKIDPAVIQRETGDTTPVAAGSSTTDGTTSNGVEQLVTVVVQGIQQLPSESASESPEQSVVSDEDNEDEDGEDSESDEDEDGEDDEDSSDEDQDDHSGEDEEYEAEEGDSAYTSNGFASASVAPYQPYSGWLPSQPGLPGATTDDLGVTYQSSQRFVYYNNTTDPFYIASTTSPTSSFHQLHAEDTSFHAERRRQKQSAYFSHFTTQPGSHSPNGHYSSNQRGRFGAGKNSGSYSPPLMAQRRDLRYQQDLHLHMSEFYLASQRTSSPFSYSSTSNQNRQAYSKDKLLELGAKETCQEKPKNLPHYLSDIYKSDSTTSNGSSGNRSRSLFGGPSGSSSSTSGSVLTRGIFSSGALTENTNHERLPSDPNLAGVALADPDGSLPRKGTKLKSKRKKNKDRSERSALEDVERPLDIHGVGGRRNRSESMDQADDTEERKTSDGALAPTLAHRGLHTPKVKPLKGNKKGQATGGKKMGGKSRHGGGGRDFSLDGHGQHGNSSEFENATMEDLHHAQHAWQRSSVMDKAAQENSVLLLEKSVRAILNKLSIDNLQTLTQSMLELDISHYTSLQSVVDLIFHKCVDEPAFAKLYASFCAGLAEGLPEFIVDESKENDEGNTTDTSGEGEEGTTTTSTQPQKLKTYSFRTLLLTKCYTLLVEDEESFIQSLHSNHNQSSHSQLSELEIQEKLTVLKCHQKGNLVLIGELYKHSLIRSSVVHLCLDMLLEEINEPSEWDVECVCTLLQTVGEKLDSWIPDDVGSGDESAAGEEASSSLRETRRTLVENHFSKITFLARNPSLPSRFRFMLLDLLDLRARAWIPRITKTVDPKSVAEIREEAQLAGLNTPQAPGKFGSNNGFMTTGKKLQRGGSVYNPHQSSHLALGGRTTVKPLPSSKPAVTPFKGRALQFGSSNGNNGSSPSPLFHRSLSAPDQRSTDAFSTAFSPLALPVSGDSLPSAVAATPGKYLPVWKRRQLGLEQEGALLPRSKKEEQEHADAAGVGGEDQQPESKESHAHESSAVSSSSMAISDLQHQLDVLVDELYSSHEHAEALRCVSDLALKCGSASLLAKEIVLPLISKAVQLNHQEPRKLCVQLLASITNTLSIPPSIFISGIGEWISLLSDVTIDVPLAPTHTNEILSSMMLQKLLAFYDLFPLYTSAIASDLAMSDDVSGWIVSLLQHLHSSVTDDSDVITLLTKTEGVNTSITSFFTHDVDRTRNALNQAGLVTIAHLLI